jgi:hypothetical protein
MSRTGATRISSKAVLTEAAFLLPVWDVSDLRSTRILLLYKDARSSAMRRFEQVTSGKRAKSPDAERALQRRSSSRRADPWRALFRLRCQLAEWNYCSFETARPGLSPPAPETNSMREDHEEFEIITTSARLSIRVGSWSALRLCLPPVTARGDKLYRGLFALVRRHHDVQLQSRYAPNQ